MSSQSKKWNKASVIEISAIYGVSLTELGSGTGEKEAKLTVSVTGGVAMTWLIFIALAGIAPAKIVTTTTPYEGITDKDGWCSLAPRHVFRVREHIETPSIEFLFYKLMYDTVSKLGKIGIGYLVYRQLLGYGVAIEVPVKDLFVGYMVINIASYLYVLLISNPNWHAVEIHPSHYYNTHVICNFKQILQ
ncbi:hypothetical protein IW262DRAFT_1294636 [Armillaria fumosa]|nr:hypothetical protein IW262DRAFT_1294636 [Armillaria fumosa]